MHIFTKIRENIIISDIVFAIKIISMILLIFYYLINADLSTAPEFIYNQF